MLATVVTHASYIAASMGRAFGRVCLSVCLFVRTLKGKRLELLTPNLVNIYSIVVARHALTKRSKGQRSRSHSTKTITVSRLLVTMTGIVYSCAACSCCQRGSACRYECLCFLVAFRFTLPFSRLPRIIGSIDYYNAWTIFSVE